MKSPGKMPKKSWRAGRGAVWVIAGMLILSGVVRLGAGTGIAIAREMEDFQTADAATPGCEPADPGSLLAALQAREADLAERETVLAGQLAALENARIEIERNMAALIAAEADLAATIALADGAAEGDLLRLTTVYESMKPKEAALLFEEMDPQFAAGFLGRMRPDTAAAILAGLSPQTAYALSVILAGRNTNAPLE